MGSLLSSFILQKSIWNSSLNFSGASNNSNAFYALGAAGALATTESDRTIAVPFEIQITGFQVNVPANSKDAATTISFRDDGADIGQVSFNAAETGTKGSTTLNVRVASGSLCCFRVDTSASASGSISILPAYVTGRIVTL